MNVTSPPAAITLKGLAMSTESRTVAALIAALGIVAAIVILLAAYIAGGNLDGGSKWSDQPRGINAAATLTPVPWTPGKVPPPGYRK